MSDIFDFFHGDGMNALGVLPLDLSADLQSENCTDSAEADDFDLALESLLNTTPTTTTSPAPATTQPVPSSPITPGT